MNFNILDKNNKQEVVALFTETFSSSEGEQEGRVIGSLVAKLSSQIDNHKILAVGAYEDELIAGAIFFSKLSFSEPTMVYMLSPVAVRTKYQGQGIGQVLINYGLKELRDRSVSVVVTYGDPAFYTKVGFQSLSEQVIQAPFKLSMPVGWLGQSLSDEPIPIMNKRPVCVEEFNDPGLW